jgi:hypothetical protein
MDEVGASHEIGCMNISGNKLHRHLTKQHGHLIKQAAEFDIPRQAAIITFKIARRLCAGNA